MIVKFRMPAPDGDRFAPGCFDAHIGTSIQLHGPHGPMPATITEVDVDDDGAGATVTAIAIELELPREHP